MIRKQFKSGKVTLTPYRHEGGWRLEIGPIKYFDKFYNQITAPLTDRELRSLKECLDSIYENNID